MNISDIAKMAGVSSAAVSRYFNNGYISEEKREVIRRVVEETGYRPSIQAQTLRTKKTKMIGVIMPRIDSYSMSKVVEGILSVLNANGYRLMLTDTQNDPQKELEYLSVFDDKQVDGVILIATVFTAAHKRALKNLTVPVVIVGQRLGGFYCVYHDDFHAIYDITKHVLDKGCKTLGYIGVSEKDKAVGEERYRGYCEAVRDAGMEALRANYVTSGFDMVSGYESARIMLSRYPDLDALVCATDKIAIGAMNYLKTQHIEIPKQIMLTGHGDSAISEVTTPTLTTIHYFYSESGEMAAKMLLEKLDLQESNVKEIKMGYSLVVNESTGGASEEKTDEIV